MAETPDEVEFDEEEAQEPTYEDASPVDAKREMIEYIARALTSHPDNVSVTDEGNGDHIFLRLSVDDEDKGKVSAVTAAWPSQCDLYCASPL